MKVYTEKCLLIYWTFEDVSDLYAITPCLVKRFPCGNICPDHLHRCKVCIDKIFGVLSALCSGSPRCRVCTDNNYRQNIKSLDHLDVELVSKKKFRHNIKSMEHLFAQCCKLNVCAFKEGGALNLMKRKKLLKMRNKYLTKSDNSNLSLRGNNGSEKKEKGRFFTNLVQII